MTLKISMPGDASNSAGGLCVCWGGGDEFRHSENHSSISLDPGASPTRGVGL